MGSTAEEREERGGRRRRAPRPLNSAQLQELALAYVARFATSRAKLVAYCRRKVRERGWDGEQDPDFDTLAERIAGLGFLDDQAYAGMKAASLLRRGYGKGRVRSALQASGIGAADGADALAAADEGQLVAALRFAERKRIGPYARESFDRPAQQKALGAMIRAGHDVALSRRIVASTPADLEQLLGEVDQSR